jgi:hypothetical protein
MGDHDYSATCVSSFEHGDNVRDVLLHYFGCLKETERNYFFASLPLYKQERIEMEMRRIRNLRAFLEEEETTKELIRKFKTSLGHWLGRTSHRISDKQTIVCEPSEKPLKENCFGMDAQVIYFKYSLPHDFSGCAGRFPNQTIPMRVLLYDKDRETNPLMQPCEGGMIKYFHLPANNMEWVEVWRYPPLHLNYSLKFKT